MPGVPGVPGARSAASLLPGRAVQYKVISEREGADPVQWAMGGGMQSVYKLLVSDRGSLGQETLCRVVDGGGPFYLAQVQARPHAPTRPGQTRNGHERGALTATTFRDMGPSVTHRSGPSHSRPFLQKSPLHAVFTATRAGMSSLFITYCIYIFCVRCVLLLDLLIACRRLPLACS